MKKAYLILFIDVPQREIVGAGIYSEPSPTVHMSICPQVLMTGEGSTYSKAVEQLEEGTERGFNRLATMAMDLINEGCGAPQMY